MPTTKTHLIIGCSICRKSIEEWQSNNADPVNDGRCCHDCNNAVVIPARVEATRRKPTYH
jgi:hypothetical protein